MTYRELQFYINRISDKIRNANPDDDISEGLNFFLRNIVDELDYSCDEEEE